MATRKEQLQKKIEDARLKLEQLQTREKQILAAERDGKIQAEKKAYERRKHLIGFGVIESIKHGRINESQLMNAISPAFTRKTDREFLGLPVSVEPAQAQPRAASDHHQEGRQ